MPAPEMVGVGGGRGGRLKGKPVNGTNDPSGGSLLFFRQVAIVKGKVEMPHAGLLSRPIAILHFAANESSPKVKPFQIDAKTHLLHDGGWFYFFLQGRVR